MADQRVLPIPSEHREMTVKSAGAEVSREYQLLSVSVILEADRISSARLVYLDGVASMQTFPLSDADVFTPGKEIEVLAGAVNGQSSIFKGIVVRQGVRIREHSAPRLVVECRHKAFSLTIGRKSACFFGMKDSDIIRGLLGAASVAGDVEDTAVVHAQQVQYRSTDWDFILSRARANGKMVFALDDRLKVMSPAFGTAPVCSLQFGSTILDFDAEIDARLQYKAVKCATWDPSKQEVVEKSAADPGIDAPGNLPSGDLAAVSGADGLPLAHSAVSGDEAQAWADAQWLKSRMSKAIGRAKCLGIESVKPGDMVSLAGVGNRYSGSVFATGVRHEFSAAEGWRTHIQFGDAAGSFGADPETSAPMAAGLLPGARGLQIGVATSNEDPDGEHRVRVKLPLIRSDPDGSWARVACADAGDDRGLFIRPEAGDEVIVGFIEDDPRRPVVLGMLHSSAKAAPLQGSDENHEKAYQSRSKMRIHFNDDTKTLSLTTPAGNSLVMSEDRKSVVVEDQNGNKLHMTEDGISLESAKALSLKAGTELKVESGTALRVKGGTELKLEGSTVAELSSPAATKVKGGMIQLN